MAVVSVLNKSLARPAGVLGAIDDGKGHWALGWDDKHPQNSGHHEFLYSFVPSLFEALEKGKPNPVKASSGGFARISSVRQPTPTNRGRASPGCARTRLWHNSRGSPLHDKRK